MGLQKRTQKGQFTRSLTKGKTRLREKRKKKGAVDVRSARVPLYRGCTRSTGKRNHARVKKKEKKGPGKVAGKKF